MVKVTCDSKTGILLFAELVEVAAVDGKKEFVVEYKATTACTLSIRKNYWGIGRIVIGDAWFGSIRTVEELRDRTLFAIMCVKQGSAGFPKQILKEQMKERGNTAFYKAATIFDDDVERDVFTGAHMDKQPLYLAATRGNSFPGEKKMRYGSRLVGGRVVKQRYELDQPNMLALYRRHFNAVDLFNGCALQSNTLPDMW